MLGVYAKSILFDVSPYGKVRFATWSQQFCNGHQYIRLFFWQQHVQDVVAQDGIERLRGITGCIEWIIVRDFKSFGPKESSVQSKA
jgi:hypothetical protein